jgi:hypothetical protein
VCCNCIATPDIDEVLTIISSEQNMLSMAPSSPKLLTRRLRAHHAQPKATGRERPVSYASSGVLRPRDPSRGRNSIRMTSVLEIDDNDSADAEMGGIMDDYEYY